MDVPELEQTDAGVLLPVKVQPGARRNEIVGWHEGRLKIRVTQAPEKGKANQALIKLLAKSLGLAKSRIELISGETMSRKLFRVANLSAAELLAQIAAILPEA